MPTARNDGAIIAGRARRLGWGVETNEGDNSRRPWLYRITCPPCDDAMCTHRVQIHSSPSDRNWQSTVFRNLNAHGFEEAEAKFKIDQELERQAKIETDRRENERKLAEAQKRALAVSKASGPYGPQVADLKWIFTAHELPETRRVLIPPELAQKILDELNTANRPLRQGRVDYWAGIIKQGKWRYTHQGMALNIAGELQDGQHRLAASVKENFTLDINLSVGMPIENFGVVDTGAGRSASDTLATLQYTNVNVLSGAIRLITIVDKYGPETRAGLKTRVPNDVVAVKVEEYGDRLEDAVRLAQNFNARRDAPRASAIAVAAAIYLIGRKLPENDERVTEFFRGYSEGTDIPAGDVRNTLRSYMFNLYDSHKRKIPVGDQLAVFIKAWNIWATKRTMKSLAFRKDELFPRVFIPARVEDEVDAYDE